SIFFFQAEDGIRDFHVTGVQTCALPIYPVQRVTKTALPRSSGGTSRPLWPGWGFAPGWSIGARIVVQEPWEYGKNTVRYTRPLFDQTRRPIRPGGPASGQIGRAHV